MPFHEHVCGLEGLALSCPACEVLREQAERPTNLVASVNGHDIYRNRSGRCDLWTDGVGWWAFDLSEEAARVTCAAVSAP